VEEIVAEIVPSEHNLRGDKVGGDLSQVAGGGGKMIDGVAGIAAGAESLGREQLTRNLVEVATEGCVVQGRVTGIVLNRKGVGVDEGAGELGELAVFGGGVKGGVTRGVTCRKIRERERLGWDRVQGACSSQDVQVEFFHISARSLSNAGQLGEATPNPELFAHSRDFDLPSWQGKPASRSHESCRAQSP